jgi:hypothetical protein
MVETKEAQNELWDNEEDECIISIDINQQYRHFVFVVKMQQIQR